MNKLLFSTGALIFAGVFFVCACCVFLFSAAFFIDARNTADEASEIQDLADFSGGASGDKVYATGQISNGGTISTDQEAGNIAQYEFVGYKIEEWNVTRSSSSSGGSTSRSTTYSGSWGFARSEFSDFELDGGEVLVSPDVDIEISGDIVEVVIPRSSGNGDSDVYNGQNLPDGSLRIQGFKNGDSITVVGSRRDGSTMTAERAHGGSRDDLVSDLESDAQTSRGVAIFGLICGGICMIPALVLIAFGIYGRRWFRTPSQKAADRAPLPGTFGSGSVNVGSTFGSPSPPPSSSIPSGTFGGGSTTGGSSPFDLPASSPSPFDPPKGSTPSPFDAPSTPPDSPFGSSYEPPNPDAPFDPPKQ